MLSTKMENTRKAERNKPANFGLTYSHTITAHTKKTRQNKLVFPAPQRYSTVLAKCPPTVP